MNRLLMILAAAAICFPAMAQTQAEIYEQRYDMLVSRVGPAGVGVQVVLDNWEKVDSTDAKMLFARFSYFFTKAQTPEVVAKPTRKYLGMDPVLSLKDSLGKDVYYYQENRFDDDLYGQSLTAADRLIRFWPDRLDYRFVKANAYIAYEKESPDMALAYLLSLVDENSSRDRSWDYEGTEADDDFFPDAMQEYCFSFYSIGSQASYKAFKTLSEKLLEAFPDSYGFMNNIGSYYLVNKEFKTALKYYDKVLKKHPEDYTAQQNALLAARHMKNVKLEKKYLNLIIKYGSDKDRMLAEGRLEALN